MKNGKKKLRILKLAVMLGITLTALFAAILFLASVFYPKEEKVPVYTSSYEFNRYVEVYKREMHKFTGYVNMRNIQILFSDSLDDNTAGVCHPIDGLILINQRYWKYYDPIQKLLVIFHELGHCDLFQAHRNNYMIMHPTLNEIDYTIPWKVLMEDFFNENNPRLWEVGESHNHENCHR